MSDADQGSQAGHLQEARAQRGRHGLAGGADRAPDDPDQRADRAPADASEGSPFAPRPAQARRSAAPDAGLSPAQESRGLPCPHQGAGPEEIARARQPPEGGSLSEPAPSELTQTSTLHQGMEDRT